MIKQVLINLTPAAASDDASVRKISASLAGIDQSEISEIRVVKRSVDARKKNIRVNLTVDVFYGEPTQNESLAPFNIKDISGKQEVIIVGAGPAGLFAALRLIELGLKPVIIERGKTVTAIIVSAKEEQALIPTVNYIHVQKRGVIIQGSSSYYVCTALIIIFSTKLIPILVQTSFPV